MGQDAEIVRAHVVISGRVQGVSFRYATLQAAQRHRVHGWVRNRADGRVEATFEGTRADVDSMIAWCKTGPPAAIVDGVEFEWQTVSERFSGFNIRF